MRCGEVAVQYITAFSRQIDLIPVWAISALGAILGAIFGVHFHNAVNPEKRLCVSFLPLWVAVALLIGSLASTYFAMNAFSQAIPEICASRLPWDKAPSHYKLGLGKPSSAPDLHKAGVYMLRAQYGFFLVAILVLIIFAFRHKRWIRSVASPTEIRRAR